MIWGKTMRAYPDLSHENDPEGAPAERKRWSAKRLLLWVLCGYALLHVLATHALGGPSRASPEKVGYNVTPAHQTTPHQIVTLADALASYEKASAICERASTAMERRTGTVKAALDACGDSLEAISDLPTLYGDQASALQSCIDMEGARFGGLSMLTALQEHRGQPGEVMTAEQNYRTRFHWAALRCRSDLLSTRRALGVTR